MEICKECFQTNIACPHCSGFGVKPSTMPATVVKDIRNFATDAYPLHASSIPDLIKCQWSKTLSFLFPETDTSGQAADTGSLTHVAVAEWHRSKDVRSSVAKMQEAMGKFPAGNLSEATTLFWQYQSDPRNQSAEIYDGWIERKITVKLSPAEIDQTQKEITIVGTIDQLRIVDGRLSIWDLKTSKRQPFDQLNMYIYQIAAYALGASAELKKPVRLGGLICPRFYKDGIPDTPAAYAPYPHKYDDLWPLINGIRFAVAMVRNGMVHPSPGEHCRYCPGSETAQCLPILRSVMDPNNRIRLPIVAVP